MNSNLLVESFQADISHLQWKIDLLRSHLLDTNDQVQFIQDQIQHQFQLQQLTKTLATYNQDQYEELRGKKERSKKLKPLKLEVQIPKLVEESDIEDEDELGNQDLYQHYKEEDNQHEIFVPESLNSQVLFDSELATNHWFQLDNENQRGKMNESIKKSYFINVYETDDEVENNEEISKFQCVYVYESPPPSPRVSQSIEDLQSEDSLEIPQQVPKSRTIRRIVYEESDDDGDSEETQIQTQTQAQIQVPMDSEQRGPKELSPSKHNILSSQVQAQVQVNSNEIARVSNSPPSKRCSPLQQQQPKEQKEQEEIEKEEKQESSFKKRNHDDDDINECGSTKQKKKRSKRIEPISDDLSSDFEIVRRPRSFPPPNYKESSYKPYRYRKPKIQINQDSYQFRKHKPEVQFLNRSHPLSKAQRSSTARAIREAEMWLKSKKR